MFSTKSAYKKVLVIIAILRFLSVLLVFKYPLFALVISLLLDSIDSPFAYRAGISWAKYTRYDKILDYWWYIFILLFSWNLAIFSVILTLFILRSVGQILVLLSVKHEYLFWFPNLLENYFIIYVLTLVFCPQLLVYFEGVGVIYPLLLAFFTKMPQEYILHRKGWFYNSKDWSNSITKVFKVPKK